VRKKIVYPERAEKYRTKGHTIRKVRDGYGLYRCTSLYVKGSYPKSVQEYLGMITEKYGLAKNGQCPSHDTIRRVMMMLDGDAIYNETVNRFHQFLRSLEDEIRKGGAYRHLAIDGKSVNGSGRAGSCDSPFPSS
jgi:hypothetical protein